MPQGRGLRLPLVFGRLSCYAEVSPFGATSFALGGKGGKTPPGVSRGRLSAPAGPPPDPRLRGLSLRPSTEVPARKIRFRVLIPPGPLGPVAVQNFGFFQFPAAPGSGQPWQGMRDRVCAGWSRSHEAGTGESGTRPYGVLTVPPGSGETGAVSWLRRPSYFT